MPLHKILLSFYCANSSLVNDVIDYYYKQQLVTAVRYIVNICPSFYDVMLDSARPQRQNDIETPTNARLLVRKQDCQILPLPVSNVHSDTCTKTFTF